MAPLEAINIENSILGSIILDNTLAYKLDELSKDMFSVSYNKEIFEKLVEKADENYIHVSSDDSDLIAKINFINKFGDATSFQINVKKIIDDV